MTDYVDSATGLPVPYLNSVNNAALVEVSANNALPEDTYLEYSQAATTPADNQVIWTSQDLTGYNLHTFKITGGSVSIQADILGDGTWSADLALRDLGSTTPSTLVLNTPAAVATVQLAGHYRNIRMLANGTTTVAATSCHTATPAGY